MTECSSAPSRARFLAGLAAVTWCWLVLAGPLFYAPGDLFMMDTQTLDVPNRVDSARQLRAGNIPFWNDRVMCGFRSMSEGQTGVLYPGFWLFVWLDSPNANDVYVALHFLLFGGTFYAYLLQRGRRPASALLASVLVMSSQFLQIAHGNSGAVACLAWLPLIMWLIDRSVATRSARPLYAVAALNAWISFTGVPHGTLMSYLIEGLYFLAVVPWRPWPRLVLRLGLLWGVTICLAAIQVWPLLLYYGDSNRGQGADWNTVASRMPPWNFWWPTAFLDPVRTGYPAPRPWNEWLWRAVFFPALLVGAVATRPRRWSLFWMCFGLASFLAATCQPFLRLLYHLPVFSWFQWPHPYLAPAALCGLVLAAHGMDFVERRYGPRSVRGQWSLLALTAGLGVLLCSDGLGRYLSRTDIYRAGADSARFLHHAAPHHLRVWPYEHLYAACAAQGKVTERALHTGMAMMAGNTNLLSGVPIVFQNEIEDTVSPREPSDLSRVGRQSVDAAYNVARIAAVTHLSGVKPTLLPDVRWLPREDWNLYELQGALPRAWLVGRTERTPERAARLARLAAPDFDAAQAALVEQDLPPFEPYHHQDSLTRYFSSGARTEVVDYRARADGLLVIATSYSPWLSATIDGAPATVFRTNHAFRGLVVPAGAHRVVVTHTPWDFVMGAALALPAWCFAILRMLGISRPAVMRALATGLLIALLAGGLWLASPRSVLPRPGDAPFVAKPGPCRAVQHWQSRYEHRELLNIQPLDHAMRLALQLSERDDLHVELLSNRLDLAADQSYQLSLSAQSSEPLEAEVLWTSVTRPNIIESLGKLRLSNVRTTTPLALRPGQDGPVRLVLRFPAQGARVELDVDAPLAVQKSMQTPASESTPQPPR